MITLTGIDERTDLAAIKQLSGGGVEFALLFSASPEGRNRYPGIQFIENVMEEMKGELAVHVCGRAARESLLCQGGVSFLKKASRIQINGVVSEEELKHALSLYERQTIITQHTDANRKLLMTWGDGRHALLVDNSGGRGIVPDKWVKPCTSKMVGFAGGLGPDTLSDQMRKMPGAFFSQYNFWLDMESRLRDEQDWFSVERALLCINIVSQWRSLP